MMTLLDDAAAAAAAAFIMYSVLGCANIKERCDILRSHLHGRIALNPRLDCSMR